MSNVIISRSSGSTSVSTDNIEGVLPIEKGGTGTISAEGVRTNLALNVRSYSYASQLGLDINTMTLNDVASALPVRSELLVFVSTYSDNEDIWSGGIEYPSDFIYGMLKMTNVLDVNHIVCELVSTVNAKNYIWRGMLNGNSISDDYLSWTGWSKLASDDDVQSCLTSVSDGKTLIASAITDMGVSTSSSDTFSTMASNIELIEGSDEIGDIIVPSIYDSLDDSYLLCDNSLISRIDYPELTSISTAYTGLMPSIYPILYTTFGSSDYEVSTGFVIGDYMVYNYNRSSTGNYMTLTGFSWSSGVDGYYTAATKYGNGYYVCPRVSSGYAMVGTSLTSGGFVTVSSNYSVYDCAFGNSLFVMGCADGKMYSSSTGSSWTASATISGICYNVIYACDKFIAFTTTGTYYSVSGTSWTLCSGVYPSSTASTDVIAVYDENRSRVFYKYDTSCYISSDGITWSFLGTSNISISSFNRLTGRFAYDPDRDRMLVMASGPTLYISTDGGLGWTRMYTGTSHLSFSICYFNGYYFFGSSFLNYALYIDPDNIEYYMLPSYAISESSSLSKLSSNAYIKAY